MKTILIVEDEFALLMVLALALEAEGFEVLRAGDGAQALALLDAAPCVAVVCDAVMPFMDAAGLLARMRQRKELASVPFVLMAHPYDRAVEGVDAVLRKPVKLPELTGVLGRLGLL